MKIVISSGALQEAVKNICQVIDTKHALPVLSNVLFRVGKDKVVLTGSDSEIYLTYNIFPNEVEGTGDFCVDANKLMDALSQLTEQPITITATTETTNMFTIEHQSGQTYFPIVNADEYPVFPDFKEKQAAMLPARDMATGLTSCMIATANDDLRPVMNGVYFNFTPDVADLVASDGHCLMRYRIEKNFGNDAGSFIMPKKVAKLLPKMLFWDDDDDVDIAWNDKQGYLYQLNWAITFRFIEGTYPNYQSVIPEDHPFHCHVDRIKLKNCISKVSPFSPESSNMIRCLFTRNELIVSADDVDFSSGANDKTYAECNVTEDLAIGMKASTVSAILSKMPYPEITIRMSDPQRAVTFEEKPVAGATSKLLGNILGLAMPMLLND